MKVPTVLFMLLWVVGCISNAVPTAAPSSVLTTPISPSASEASPLIRTLTPIPTPSLTMPTLFAPLPTSTSTGSPTPVPVGTPTPIITSTWNVYENREQGFRIRYPSLFTASIYPLYGPEVLHTMIFYDGTKYQPPFLKEFPFIGLEVLTNPQRLSAESWAQAHVYRPGTALPYSLQFASYEIVRTLNIAGIRAPRLAVTSAANGIVSQVVLISLPDEAKMVNIYYHIDPSTLEPLFELMALTFERTR